MKSKRIESTYVYLSFWEICLENLPAGLISHKLIDKDEAKKLISDAKKDNNLFCVVSSNSELQKNRGEKKSPAQQLCSVLKEHCDIDISLKDFLHK